MRLIFYFPPPFVEGEYNHTFHIIGSISEDYTEN